MEDEDRIASFTEEEVEAMTEKELLKNLYLPNLALVSSIFIIRRLFKELYGWVRYLENKIP